MLALPRGGVPVGFELARTLRLPLEMFIVRKLGVPGNKELAMGAIAPDGTRAINQDIIEALHISPEQIDAVAEQERLEIQRRQQEYRNHRPQLEVRGRTVILVDDGLATGSTMRAAIQSLRQQDPAYIVVAVPVAAPSICDELAKEVDEIVCAFRLQEFVAVGQWYYKFKQTSDEEVRRLLALASKMRFPRAA